MTFWGVVLGVLALAGGVAAMYGLHRLALWLESKGHLYYLHKQPEGSSPAASLTALQDILEPQAKHVRHVKDERRKANQDEGGPADPPMSPAS